MARLQRAVFDAWLTQQKDPNNEREAALALLEKLNPRFAKFARDEERVWDAFKLMDLHPEVPKGRDQRAIEARWLVTMKFARDVLGFAG